MRVPAIRRVFTLALLSLIVSGGTVPLAAQDATPFASTDREAFIVPVDECSAEPLTAQEVTDIVGADTETSPAAAELPEGPFGAPDGDPADPETAAAVTSVIRASWACQNAGDWPRFFAILSEDEIRREFGPNAINFARQPVAPYPIDQQTAVYAVLDVEVLSDGRVGAFVIVDTPGDPLPVEINYQIAVETEEGWKLDGFVCFTGAGTVC